MKERGVGWTWGVGDGGVGEVFVANMAFLVAHSVENETD